MAAEVEADVVGGGVAMVNSVGILERRKMLRVLVLKDDDATLLAMDVFDSPNAPFDIDIGCVASTGWVSSESTSSSETRQTNAETERTHGGGAQCHHASFFLET